MDIVETPHCPMCGELAVPNVFEVREESPSLQGDWDWDVAEGHVDYDEHGQLQDHRWLCPACNHRFD